MKTIVVNKAELLGHLRLNRDIHVEEYNSALAAYRDALIEAFKVALRKAKNYEDIQHGVYIERPRNYVESYDTAITQLEWHLGDQIELDQHEFKQYVQDEWNWKNEFMATASLYKG